MAYAAGIFLFCVERWPRGLYPRRLRRLGENEKGEGGRSRATPSFPLLNPHPLGYAKDASVRLQSDSTTECILNGAAELL